MSLEELVKEVCFMESILTSIKKMLGITEEDTYFNPDIIMAINSVFVILNQIGIGPDEIFYIEDDVAIWNDFTNDDDKLCNLVKPYMYLKVKTLFDPQANATVTNSIEGLIREFEWRLNVAVDPTNKN